MHKREIMMNKYEFGRRLVNALALSIFGIALTVSAMMQSENLKIKLECSISDFVGEYISVGNNGNLTNEPTDKNSFDQQDDFEITNNDENDLESMPITDNDEPEVENENSNGAIDEDVTMADGSNNNDASIQDLNNKNDVVNDSDSNNTTTNKNDSVGIKDNNGSAENVENKNNNNTSATESNTTTNKTESSANTEMNQGQNNNQATTTEKESVVEKEEGIKEDVTTSNQNNNSASENVPEQNQVVVTPKTSKEALDLINAERVALGLEPAVWDAECERIAMLRAQELYELERITVDNAHDGFYKFQKENKKLCECVAWGYSSAIGAVDGWMNSSGHRDALMRENRTKIAIVYYGDRWVAINSR
jgi:uncharacterized protein YkwD